METKNYKLKTKSVLRFIFFIFSFSLLTFLGCQKVININLNSASPALVVTGNIDDLSPPYIVTLNQTVNFSDPNQFPTVSGAFVTISDNVGTTDTLKEVNPGVYNTTKIQGVQGRTYSLKIITGGQTYTASSTMPQVVTFDTLVTVNQINSFRKDTNIYPMVVFLDPVGASPSHYYRFIEKRNDSVVTRLFVIDDQFDNGRYINYTMRSDTSLHHGDLLFVQMQCIDQPVYQYFSTFRQATGSTNVTPFNPISNLSNGALGYFSAHTAQNRFLIVK